VGLGGNAHWVARHCRSFTRGAGRRLTIGLVLALVASVLGGVPALAAPKKPRLPDLLHPEKPVPFSAVPLTHRPRPAAVPSGPRAHAAWPAAGQADVTIAAVGGAAAASTGGTATPAGRAASASHRAGALPISVTSAARTGTLHVSLADRAATRKAGVSGVLFHVSGAALASVGLDYGAFRNAGGANWANRVRLVSLPACALTTPGRHTCQVQTPLDSHNDATTTTVSARVTGTDAVLAAVAGSAGSNGDFTASSVGPSGTWSVSTASGGFGWSYPIQVPPAAAGDVAPSVALSYSSQSVDGRIASTNNQSTWIGEGWDYSPGFIERTYRSCADDPAGTAPKTGDLCWAGQIVNFNLGGQSTALVLDDSTRTWHPANDNGERVELLTGGNNGAKDGEYWRVTRVDGTQYYFGREHLPGAPASTATLATWTAPVYGAHTNDPCNDPRGFDQSSCQQAWRWNLDYVVDPHGNAAAYYYDREDNWYAPGDATTGTTKYARGGALNHIDYGLRESGGSVFGSPAQDQVVFATAPRCVAANCAFTGDNAANWPDTPQDQDCKQSATCNVHAPTFWTTRRLTAITTQYRSGSGYTKVDSYALGQSFPSAGDPELSLDSLTRTGFTPGGAAIAVSPIRFTSQLMANRVSGFNSQPEMLFWRLTTIVTETGESIAITYSQPDCTSTSMPASPSNNTKLCYPVFWTLPFQSTPTLDYFHKYVTKEVDVQDDNAVSPTQVTTYKYLGNPAWHQDDNEVVKPANRTFGQFRGFGQVETRTGNIANSQNGVADKLTLSRTTYYRGMGGTVTDSLGESDADDEAFADMTRESQTFNGDGGAAIGSEIDDPVVTASTASRARTGLPALVARMMGSAKTRNVTNLAAGGTQTTTVANRYDRAGRLVATTDSASGLPDICTTRKYAENLTSWLRDRVSETITSTQTCPADSATAPSPVVGDSRTYYDGATTLGSVTGAGDATRVENLTTNAGGNAHYAATTATYDPAGRAKSSTVFVSGSDSTGRTTTLAYTPADGGPLAQVATTNAKGQTTTTKVDAGRGSTLEVTDLNGQHTDATYDALGRLTATWLPGHDIATQQASVTYAYRVDPSKPLAVTTRTLVDDDDATSPLHYATTTELYDAYGQLRQTQSDAEGGGRVIGDTFYDSHGWAVRANNRWFTTGAPDTTLVSTADSAVNSRSVATYDGAGRRLVASAYNGLTFGWSTTTVYGGDRVTEIPPSGGVSATTLVNARGQTTEVREYTAPPTVNGSQVTGGTYQSTTYHYTALGQQDGITDPDGRQWTFGYDLADRKTSQQDPDSGASSYNYDDAGDLTTLTDGRGTTLAYSYDDLGRRTGEYLSSLTGTKLASWSWDTATNGVGKIATTARYIDGNAYQTGIRGYDPSNGQPTAVVVGIPASETGLSGIYTTTYGYTSTGLQKTVKPADGGGLPGETIATTFTTLGDPKGTGGYNDYVDATAYTPFGEPQQLSMGASPNQAQLTYDRDPQTRRISQVTLSAAVANPQLDLTTYAYDAAGNIVRKSDTQGGTATAPVRTECYHYDRLARLSEAWTTTSTTVDCGRTTPTAATVSGPTPYWTTWGLDPVGLRTQQVKHGLGGTADTSTTYSYGRADGGQPHTLTGTTTTSPGGQVASTYGYDASGNTTSRPGQTLSWDAEDRLAQVTTSAGVTGYVYDADGDVLVRRDPGQSTLYLPGEELTKTTSGVTGTRYYAHGGLTIALRVGGANPVYLDGDQNSTNQIAVDSATFAVTRRSFDPYGNQLGATSGGAWPDSRGFLNAPVDAATGLVDVGERRYDPVIGRFISADPVIDPTDSQSLSGYAYADDSPVTNSDPTGELCTNGPDGSCWNSKTGDITPTPGVTDRQSIGVDMKHPKPAKLVGAEHDVYNAKIRSHEKQQKLLGIGKEILKLVADTLGITPALDCITGGGLSDCLQTAGNVLLSFAGGVAGKLLSKYGAPWKWKAGIKLVDRLWSLVHKGIDAIRELIKVKGEVGDAERTLKTVENASCLVPHSFSAATTVLMADGSTKPISTLKVGDKVRTVDTKTGRARVQTVTAVLVHLDHDLYDLTVRDGGKVEVVHSTASHPIWDQDRRQWVNADHLATGTALRTPDGSAASVARGAPAPVADGYMWDLTVDTDHDFFVRAAGSAILVHNCDDAIPEIVVDAGKYPAAAQHLTDRMDAGWDGTGVVDRSGVQGRRQEAMRGNARRAGSDRDEVPPAVLDTGEKATVRYIAPSDNRGAGASIGHQLRGIPNGTRVQIRVKPAEMI
jgi:RHS repeat-associated protein